MKHLFVALAIVLCMAAGASANNYYTVFNNASTAASTNWFVQVMNPSLTVVDHKDLQAFRWDSTVSMVVTKATQQTAIYPSGTVLQIMSLQDGRVYNGEETTYWPVFAKTPLLVVVP